MVSLVIFSGSEAECRQLQQAVRDRFAYHSEDGLSCSLHTGLEAAVKELLYGGASLIGWDVDLETARRAILSARPRCRDAFLLVIASPETSPLTFLTPALRPDTLLLRPLEEPEVRRAASEMLAAVRRAGEQENFFSINRRDEQQRIPCSSIYYFEARGRRLYARLHREELGFAGTLEQLEEELPENFRRTHRSFIVNMDKVEQLLPTENLLVLWDGLTVPLSRSYKKEIREYCHG